MFAKLQFEKNARYINSHLERQSDCNIFILSYRSGLTALSKMSGQEIPGLCVLIIFSMGGMLGPENTDLEKDFTLLLWLGISINDTLFIPQYTEICVIPLKERIKRFMSVTKTLVGPQREMICNDTTELSVVEFNNLLSDAFVVAALKPQEGSIQSRKPVKTTEVLEQLEKDNYYVSLPARQFLAVNIYIKSMIYININSHDLTISTMS